MKLNFLRNLFKSSPFQLAKSIEYQNTRKSAAVACILRIDSHTTKVNVEPITADSILRTLGDEDINDLKILLIKRAVRPGDRWSGDLAFPGGHLSENESDYEAVCRETLEEVGLDLKDKSKYIWLGRLHEQGFRGRKGGILVTPHLFLCCDYKESELKLQLSEVSHAWWTDFEPFLDINQHSSHGFNIKEKYLNTLSRKFGSLFYFFAHSVLLFLGVSKVYFPCVYMEPPSTEAIDSERWVLWGMTLSIVRRLLLEVESPAKQFSFQRQPPLWFDNPVLNIFTSNLFKLRAWIGPQRLPFSWVVSISLAGYFISLVSVVCGISYITGLI